MRADKGIALERGQDAGGFGGVRFLPGGHGGACAGAEGAVDGRVVEAEPLQRGLHLLPRGKVERRFRGAGLGRGFGGGGIGGQGGQRLGFRQGIDRDHVLGGFGRGGFGCCRLLECRFGSGRGPERIAEIAFEGDEAVGGDQAFLLQVGKPGRSLGPVVGTKQDAIPARAQGKALNVGKGRGVGAGAFQGLGAGRLRLDLDPGAVLGLGGAWHQKQQCQDENCDQPGEAGGPAFLHVVPVFCWRP